MRAKNFWWLTVWGLLLGGCGGGGGSAPVASVATVAEETGQVVIALTDAEGDFASYTLDVTSIVLQRTDGSVVETLPLTTRVDFAELTEVTELLTIATVPAGRYEAVTLGLDFRNAEVIVQDAAGGLQPATLLDESGRVLESLDVRLQLAQSDSILIRRGIPAAFSLDFDLDASNSIDLTGPSPVVTVMPFLLASAELEADRVHRLRGLLEAVDEGAQTVSLKVRPFRHRRGDFGQFSFQTGDETLFEIDGVGYAGVTGLTALAELPVDSPVVAGGTVISGELVADRVLAGSSVPWTSHDVAAGVVVSRAEDHLTLSGVLLEYRDGVTVRRDEVSVLLGEDTGVTALGLDNSLLDSGSISIGQRVVAFGELTDDLSLDASADHVRMQISNLTAAVVEPEPLALDLYHLNARRPSVFDFSGTGTDPLNDADPDYYEVDTSTLGLGSIEAGDLVQVRGHVNGYGMAPDDFLALTVVDVGLDMRSASFAAVWPDPTVEPLLEIGTRQIILGLEQARSILKVTGVPRAETNPLESLSMIAPPEGRGVYAVRVRGAGEIHLYREFAALSEEIQNQLQIGNLLKRVGAHGRYNETDPGSEELVTGRAAFEFVRSGE